MKQAAIIGAGVGGLATAIRLVARGYAVDVFEKEPAAGGKLSEKSGGGFRFDLGPSLFTQPERVCELFELLGENPDDYLRFERLPIVCRYYWDDGSVIEVPSDRAAFALNYQRSGGDPAPVIQYLDAAEHLYNVAAPVFLDGPFPSRKALMSRQGRLIGRNPGILDPFFTLHQRNRKSFRDSRLVQLFDRYATYNGSNPYRAPATLKLIAHLEHNQGAWFPEHGMYSIARELAALASRHGVSFQYQAEIQKINLSDDQKRVTGIRINDTDLDYPVVVSNIDVNTMYHTGLIGRRMPLAGRGQQLSSSALIWYWGVKGVHPQLDVHNILFSGNYREEFRHLFRLRDISDDPTVYLFVSSKIVPADAPPGHENWFVMVNAPENVGQNWDSIIQRTRHLVMGKIKTILGIDLQDLIVYEHVEHPGTIGKRTGSWHGSLYGYSSNSRASAFSRHPNHRNSMKGLYFAGGSVHPGGGIPLCLASAKIAASLIAEEED